MELVSVILLVVETEDNIWDDERSVEVDFEDSRIDGRRMLDTSDEKEEEMGLGVSTMYTVSVVVIPSVPTNLVV